MECIGARNFATMAVSARPTWRPRRKRLRNMKIKPVDSDISPLRLTVIRCSAGNESSCIAVKEEFADEEDYVKAGGSELLFVQMQQNKGMNSQSKFSDKLPRIPTGDSLLDLVVIGCGPAGLALAAESAKLGLTVGLIGPDLPFTNNYGVWEDEFKDLGLEGCIEHVWRDTIVYLNDSDPIMIGRAYGRVSRHLLHEELLKRCVESGVSYLSSKVDRIIEASNGQSLVECENNIVIPCRLATVASGAASGKLLQYEVGGPRVSVQTAYGVEVEVENNPYDPSLMVFMDYRDYIKQKVQTLEAQYPTFLYAMPMSPTRVFFEETCLASKDAMPFDLLKKKLMSRLQTMGIRVTKIYEEEWSYIPVGGSLPNTEQKNLAFGAAASMVHPATGYSVVRSLSEAPNYADVIANILKRGHINGVVTHGGYTENISMQAWKTLWPQERKRQRAFFLFGLALILQLDIEGIRTFFQTFFRLPTWMWQGFLGSSLSSVDLILFAFYMFIIAPHNMRMSLVRHLLSDPTGATMVDNAANLDHSGKLLKTALEELAEARKDLEGHVDQAESLGLMCTNQVKGWLRRVEKVEGEVNSIRQDVDQQKQCLWCCCANCCSRYKLRKKVVQKLSAIKELMEKGKKLDMNWGDGSIIVPVMEIPSGPAIGIYVLLEKVYELLKKEEVGIIGIYGMGGLKCINNEFLTLNHDFNVVTWATVSKDFTVEKIQQAIGLRLGLSLG